MGIEITKDIDRYKETVFMGLTASAYVAVSVVAPIALNSFFS